MQQGDEFGIGSELVLHNVCARIDSFAYLQSHTNAACPALALQSVKDVYPKLG